MHASSNSDYALDFRNSVQQIEMEAHCEDSSTDSSHHVHYHDGTCYLSSTREKTDCTTKRRNLCVSEYPDLHSEEVSSYIYIYKLRSPRYL